MTGLVLYGQGASRTFRCLWMLEELGIAFENIPVNPRNEETRAAEFLQLNPNGHVPVLVDDGVTVWESLAINLHLAKKYQSPLTPTTEADMARALQWSMWALTELESDVGKYLEAVQPPDGAIDDDLANTSAGGLKAPLKVLNQQLAEREWLLGDQFTVADLNVAAVLSPLPYVQFFFYPNRGVIDWLRRCLTRSAAIAARDAGIASLTDQPDNAAPE